MLAATENNNATQNGNYYISFDMFSQVVRLYGASLQILEL